MTFFLDQDVPEEVAQFLRHQGHPTTVLREVLAITASDAEVFGYARTRA